LSTSIIIPIGSVSARAITAENWVAGALELPRIKSVTSIGPDSDDLTWWHFYLAPRQELSSGRLKLFPYRRRRVRVPLVRGGGEFTFDTIEQHGAAAIFQRVSTTLAGRRRLPEHRQRLSVPEDAATDWEQGQLSVETS